MISWLDVEFALETYRADKGLPDWLLRYTVYQDELDLELTSNDKDQEVDNFLGLIFGARYVNRSIALESTPDFPRIMRVCVEEAEDAEVSRKLGVQVPPTFRRIAALPESGGDFNVPDFLPDSSPQIIAFYSFKGGVGRTTHLLAYLQALSMAKEKRSALVIDADLEAPGITSLISHENSLPAATFSFIDLLALAQSDSSADWEDSLRLATYFVRRQVLGTSTQTGDLKHYFLPAFRSEEQAMRLDIRPEHLTGRPGQAWSLPAFLMRLAVNLEVDVILLDLRAGYSELASPFLFDPRVKKMLITTPSSQSVDGTVSILRQLSKIVRRTNPEITLDPTVFVSFVLPELVSSDFIRNIISRVQQSYPELNADENWPSIQTLTTPFAQELLYLDSFNDALAKLAPSVLTRKMVDLVEFDLPPKEHGIAADEISIDKIRRRLTDIAAELEYAESGKGDRFLRIAPLRALAQQYPSAPPVAVIIGAKGAGKTYTYLQILRAGNWSGFVNEVSGGNTPERARLWPVLYSTNLSGRAQEIVKESRLKTMKDIEIGTYLNSIQVADMIREALDQTDADETWWRHRWFQILAASMGLPTEPFNAAGSAIINHLRTKQKHLVVMIDGLEDLFPELAKNSTQQLALRSLIQGVPSYLKEVPDNPLGILIFIRADLARVAIPQNYGQFSRLYDAFALQWNEEEALRLAVWLADFAGVKRPEGLEGVSPERLSREEAKDALLTVWGRKLGTEKSREARSAEWVIAALSDFKGQIQARDLVRFLHYSAEGSIQSSTADRVLNPTAIRNAIKPCSEKKIEEAVQEIPQLKAIFSKLLEVSDLRIPFDAVEANLSTEDIRFLQNVGVVAELDGKYYVPEIFRFGLGLRLSEGARPKVLSFARRLL
jgi:MinD-like ATPase involved in chromosome partitioning or flagellar assembly